MQQYAISWPGQYLFLYTPIPFFLNWIFSEGQGLILVYSVASRSTFEDLNDIHQRVKRGNAIFMLVGNKCDKTQERQVSKADGAALARQYGCGFIETSAKTTQNVKRLFINLIRSLRQTKDTKQESHQGPHQKPHQSAEEERKPCKCVIL